MSEEQASNTQQLDNKYPYLKPNSLKFLKSKGSLNQAETQELIRDIERLHKDRSILLSSEQEWKEKAEHNYKATDTYMKLAAESEGRNYQLGQQLNQAVKVLKEIRDCLDDFYTREHPRRLHPELRYLAGQISVMDKITTDFLSSLSQEGSSARCVKCDKEFEHDLYSCWCNECGEYAEKEVREGRRKPSESNINNPAMGDTDRHRS